MAESFIHHEIVWALEPALSSGRTIEEQVEGFEVKIAEDRMRFTASVASPDLELYRRADIVAASLVLSLAVEWEQPMTHHVISRQETGPGRIHAEHFETVSLTIRDEVTITSTDGQLLYSSRITAAESVTSRAAEIRADKSLQRLFMYYTEFQQDPERNLAPLYNVIELLDEVMGRDCVISEFGISKASIKTATRHMNDASKIESRHKGKTLGVQSHLTPEEMNHCVTLVKGLIAGYRKYRGDQAG